MTKKSTTFGWLGVLTGLLIMIFFQGAIGNQLGLMMDPVCETLGIARTVYSTMVSVTTLVNLLCSLTFAKFLTTIGIKKMTIIGALGAVLYCVFLLLSPHVGSAGVVFLALGHLCFGVCFSWAGAMSASILINNWFAKRSSTMISIVSAFGGLTGTVAAPLITSWIMNSGWQTSIVYRTIPVVIVFILFFLIIRVEPGPNDKRVWEDESTAAESAEGAGDAGEVPGMTLAEARKSSKFWLGIITIFGFGLLIYPASVVCLPALTGDLGFAANAGTVMSVFFAANLIVTLVLGGLVEKFGCRIMLTLVIILTIISLVMLSMKGISLSMVYLASVLLGVGYSLVVVATPLITIEVFGPKDFGSIQSFLFSAMVLGMVLGSPLFNLFYDGTGSYSLIYRIAGIALVVIIITLFAITSKSKNDTVKI